MKPKDYHLEPYVCLSGLTHDSALITWGAFFFKRDGDEIKEPLEDDDLVGLIPRRTEVIGAAAPKYSPGDAVVVVREKASQAPAGLGTVAGNSCLVRGLRPDTEYVYTILVDGGLEWGGGQRWDWKHREGRLRLSHRTYRNEFRTFPDPKQPAPPFTFAVLGDFGIGIRRDSKEDARQRNVATALVKAVEEEGVRFLVTTGDNVYAHGLLKNKDEGDEDDDWFFTYYQPYRYLLNRIPVYPCLGNHDASETEGGDPEDNDDRMDDRGQIIDNLYLLHRLQSGELNGPTLDDANRGVFYRFSFGSHAEFVALDSSLEKDDPKAAGRFLFEDPRYTPFVSSWFPDRKKDPKGRWSIPFFHHPPFCAGPRHMCHPGMPKSPLPPSIYAPSGLVPTFERAGVRVVFNGHEHNFQHASHQGVEYVTTGAGGSLRTKTPKFLKEAKTVSWQAEPHFLLVTIAGPVMTIRVIKGQTEPQEELADVSRIVVGGGESSDAIQVQL